MKPSLQTNYLIKTILDFSEKKRRRIYFVGGYLRDILLNRQRINLDIDFCLKNGSIGFGRQLAQRMKAGFVVLDKERGACRLVKKINDRVYTLDFMDFRGKDLEEDLLHRDFTVNTLALRMQDHALLSRSVKLKAAIIDPYAGQKDLQTKAIRMVHKKAFDDDPLRILRAFSLACIFGFKIEQKTLGLIGLKKKKLKSISAERIRDELFKILDTADSFSCIRQMDSMGVLEVILPEIEIMRNVRQGPYHHLDVWKHTLETLRQLEMLFFELKGNQEIQDYLNETISSEHKRRALLKLGCLLHDIGKPKAMRHKKGKTTFYGHERIGLDITQNLAGRLRLSNDELNSLSKMVFWHLRPGYLADNAEVSPRAKFRYFRDSAQEAISILLLSLADQRATKGPLTTKKSRLQHERIVFSLMREYFRNKNKKKTRRLINGNDLIRRCKLSPSPLIGKILREVEELQAIGRLKNKEEALQAAERFISKERDARD